MAENTTSSEPTQNSDIKAVVDAIAGGNNVAAQQSFDQIMQTKLKTALNSKTVELAGNLFTPPEPTAGIDTGITGDPTEVEEEE